MATGIIQDKMARPEGQELSAEAVRSNIKMPPELQNAYDRVVTAGMKIMFDKNSHQLLLKEIQGPGSTGEKLGKGIVGLMMVMFQKSNKTMPPAVMVPAGLELLMQAADFANKAGLMKVTNKDIGEGVDIMINLLLKAFGVKPQQIQQMLNQYDNRNVDAAAQQMGA